MNSAVRNVDVVGAADVVVVLVVCVVTWLLLRYGAWRPHADERDSRPRERVHTDSWPSPRTARPPHMKQYAPQKPDRQPALLFGAPLGLGTVHTSRAKTQDQENKQNQKDQQDEPGRENPEPVSARGRNIWRSPLG